MNSDQEQIERLSQLIARESGRSVAVRTEGDKLVVRISGTERYSTNASGTLGMSLVLAYLGGLLQGIYIMKNKT